MLSFWALSTTLVEPFAKRCHDLGLTAHWVTPVYVCDGYILVTTMANLNVVIIFYCRSQWRYNSTACLLCNLLSASGQGATQWHNAQHGLESGFWNRQKLCQMRASVLFTLSAIIMRPLCWGEIYICGCSCVVVLGVARRWVAATKGMANSTSGIKNRQFCSKPFVYITHFFASFALALT